jgi:hypothetical protein
MPENLKLRHGSVSSGSGISGTMGNRLDRLLKVAEVLDPDHLIMVDVVVMI